LESVESRNTLLALEVEKDDDEMDKLHRGVISALTGSSWNKGVDSVIGLTLLECYYERYADHAVSVARRVYFLVTGEYAPA
jgi:phosphate transport system protein